MDILRRVEEESFLRNRWEIRFDEIIYEMYKNGNKLLGEVLHQRN